MVCLSLHTEASAQLTRQLPWLMARLPGSTFWKRLTKGCFQSTLRAERTGSRRDRCYLLLTLVSLYFCTGSSERESVQKWSPSGKIILKRQLPRGGYPVRNMFKRKANLMLDSFSGKSENIIEGAETRGTDSKKQSWKEFRRWKERKGWGVAMKNIHCEP